MILVSRMALQKVFGGQIELTLFLVIHACESATISLVTTHSHLNKYQHTLVCGDQVDFSRALSVVAFDDAQAMDPQPGCGDQFSDPTFAACREKQGIFQGVAGDSISR